MRIKLAVLAVAAVSFGGAQFAFAADLPTKAPYYKAPPMARTYNWSGCYLGVHAGGGWARTNYTNTASTALFVDLLPGDSLTQNSSGFIGGGQIGCNYQINQFVIGLEGSFAGSTLDSDLTDPLRPAFDDVFTVKINSIATVTGRLGYAMNNWLIYTKGGYAGADVKFAVSDTTPPFTGGGSDTQWRSGWTVGGGIEYGLTPNWILGVEYDYINLGTSSDEVGGGAGLYTFDVKTQIQQAVARLSYKFW